MAGYIEEQEQRHKLMPMTKRRSLHSSHQEFPHSTIIWRKEIPLFFLCLPISRGGIFASWLCINQPFPKHPTSCAGWCVDIARPCFHAGLFAAITFGWLRVRFSLAALTGSGRFKNYCFWICPIQKLLKFSPNRRGVPSYNDSYERGNFYRRKL